VLADLCEKVDFDLLECRRLRSTLSYVHADEACDAALSGGPVALAWSRFSDDTRQRVRKHYVSAIDPWRQESGYRIPGEFVIVAARRPLGSIAHENSSKHPLHCLVSGFCERACREPRVGNTGLSHFTSTGDPHSYVELLKIPNIASDREGIRRNADAILTQMRHLNLSPRLLQSTATPDAPPVVYGEWKVPEPGGPGSLCTLRRPTSQSGGMDDRPFTPTFRTGPITAGGTVIPRTRRRVNWGRMSACMRAVPRTTRRA